MDKKVWAIVAIIALHLSLMWFLRGSLKPEELARAPQTDHPAASPIEPNPYLLPQVVVPERAAVEEANPSEPDDLALVSRRSRVSVGHSRKPERQVRTVGPVNENEPSAFAQRAVAFTPPVFQDTVIVVKQSEVRPVYQSEAIKLVEPKAVPSANITPVKKRKSFIRRAGTVVRKPYYWVKALVSKL